MSHPDDSTIERFAMGMLDDDADFVAHVGGCDECSRKLQREAEVELAMFEVQARFGAASRPAEARAPSAPGPRPRLARRVLGPALAFAAAAAVLAWVGHRRARPAPEATAAVRVVTCPDGPRQLDCIAEAHRSGSRLEYPKDSPIAALGREPGLSVHVVPRSSDGIVTELDAQLGRITADFKACAQRAVVWQDAPMRTGEVSVEVSIEPDGRVREPRLSLVVPPGAQRPDLDRPSDPAVHTDLELARCLRRSIEASPFERRDRTVRVSLSAKYVWRE